MFFAVATLTRSMMYTYVAVVGFLVLYFVFLGVVGGEPEYRDTAALFEPLGLAAVGVETRYWTAAELNSQLPELTGNMLANRLGAIGVSIVALGVALWRFSFAERGLSARKARKLEKQAAKLAKTEPQTVATLPETKPETSGLARLITTTRFEISQVVRSPAFPVLLALGLVNCLASLIFGTETYGTPRIPATFSIIEVVLGSFVIIPLIIAIYYGGELVWRDRDRKFHEIVDSTSLPGWAYMVPKTIAVTFVLFATLFVSMLAAIAVQASRGYFNFEIEKYLSWYVLPLTVDLLMIAILSVFVQALSPNKYIGWGLMLLYFVASETFNGLGLGHPLILYGEPQFTALSDMNANSQGGALSWWMRLYFGGMALLMAVLAHLMWRRGTEVPA